MDTPEQRCIARLVMSYSTRAVTKLRIARRTRVRPFVSLHVYDRVFIRVQGSSMLQFARTSSLGPCLDLMNSDTIASSRRVPWRRTSRFWMLGMRLVRLTPMVLPIYSRTGNRDWREGHHALWRAACAYCVGASFVLAGICASTSTPWHILGA